ncbi:hypothetical protein [Rhizobium sp. Rhizsp82]|uniref:hypothetical protein n=1 Tax=Rhizobium sp. Rhizsp82 TaxID=3243057 RepID=UPI0039B54EF4
MNYLDFFASLFSSLVSLGWPAAVVASVYIFRKEIRPLLPHMRLKHKDTEVSFRLDAAERAVDQLPPPAPDAAPPTPEELSNFERLARISPRSAMIEMRREIADNMTSYARALGWSIGGNLSGRSILRRLRESNSIDSVAASLLDDALAVGNAAAHDTMADFSYEDALRYRGIVDHAIRILEAGPTANPVMGRPDPFIQAPLD